MGTDIYFAVESRTGGTWERCEAMLPDPESGTLNRRSWYDERNYELFFLLAGLESPRPVGPPSAVISEPRGLPEDLSDETAREFSRFLASGTFGMSWLSAHDLVAYDWHQPVTNTYFATRPTSMRRRGRRSRMLSDDEVRRHVQQNGVPPVGWGRAGSSRDGVQVTAVRTPALLAGEFLEVVHRIESLSPDDPLGARCVFWFDR